MAISLTEKAAQRVTEFIRREPGSVGLRLGVKKTGCSGWGYTVDIARQVKPDDRVFACRGVQLVVDSQALALVDGTEIDFAQQGLNQVFKFKNPNSVAECGCGESFSVLDAVAVDNAK